MQKCLKQSCYDRSKKISTALFLASLVFSAQALQAKEKIRVSVSEAQEDDGNVTGISVTVGSGAPLGEGETRIIEVERGQTLTLSVSASFSPDSGSTDYSGSIAASVESLSECYPLVSQNEAQSTLGASRWWSYNVQDGTNNGSTEATFTVGNPANSPKDDFGEPDVNTPNCGCANPSGGGGGSGGGSGGPPDTTPRTEISFGMGRGANGLSVGNVYFRQELTLTSALSRSQFSFDPLTTLDFPSISDSTGLRQIVVPEGILDISDQPGGAILLRFYPASNYAPGTFGNTSSGLYVLQGAPIVEQTISSTSDPNHGVGLLLSTLKDGQTKVQAVYGDIDPEGNFTRKVETDGSITEIDSLVTQTSPTEWTRVVETRKLVVDNGNEVVVSHIRDEYITIAGEEVWDRNIVDPEGANLTTLYAYYNNENDPSIHLKTKHMINPDGSWEKYTYDSAGLISKTYRPWKDTPAHPDDAGDPNCRYVEVFYDANGEENASAEYILGNQVRGTSLWEDTEFGGDMIDGEYHDLINIRSFTQHGGSGPNIVTTTSYLRKEEGITSKKGNVYRQFNDNHAGTRQRTDRGYYDEPNDDFIIDDNGSHTRRVVWGSTLFDVDGVANKTTKNIIYSDFKGPFREETRVYTGTAFERVSLTTYQYEPGNSRRMLSIIRDGDTVSSTNYVNSLQIVETDSTGIETQSNFDAAGKLLNTVKLGAPAGVNYEAQGPITTTYTDGPLTSTVTVSSGTLNTATSTTNDLASRIVSSTDELGRTTTYAYAN